MFKYLFMFLTAVAAVTFVLPGGGSSPDYKYKMTVYADDKAFSSVRRVKTNKALSIVDSSGSTTKRKLAGQAVIMERNGQTFYALLSRPERLDYGVFVTGMALAEHIPASTPENKRSEVMFAIKGPRDLPRTTPNRDRHRGPREHQNWPMFVTFGKPDDPRTVKQVSPEFLGVERITIELTDEEVTTGIENKLPDSFWQRWGEQHKEAVRKGGGFMNPGDNSNFDSLTGRLSKGYFVATGE